MPRVGSPTIKKIMRTQCCTHAMCAQLGRAACGKFGNRNPLVVSYSCAVMISHVEARESRPGSANSRNG